jgi:metal-responsive CopG/Arc/MetJ family transcriptional regulator
MKTQGPTDALVPPGLLAEVQAAADEEHRAPAELVREAIERYLDEREWRKLLAYGQERARALGLTEADVLRLITAARREHSRKSGKAAK